MSRDYHANTWLLQSLAPMYYRNANCAVVVYDITQAVSHRVKRERRSPDMTQKQLTHQAYV